MKRPSQLSEDRVRPEAGEGPPAAGARLVADDRGTGSVNPGEVFLELVELHPGTLADIDAERSLDKDLADSAAKVEGQRNTRSDPARASPLGGGLHVGDAVVPVDVRHLPVPACEQEHDRTVAADLERERMHETELRPSVSHGEERVAGEHRHELHEVPAAEGALAFDSDRQHPAVLDQYAAGQHELDDVVEMLERHRPERGHRTEPLAPRLAPDVPLLQGEGEELLREEVERFRWRYDGFDVAVEPESEQTGRSQERDRRACRSDRQPMRRGARAALDRCASRPVEPRRCLRVRPPSYWRSGCRPWRSRTGSRDGPRDRRR